MRNFVAVSATAAALVAVAACNKTEQAGPSGDNQAEATENITNGSASTTDHKAIMKARHDHYEEMGDAMKAIGVQLKGDSPSVPVIQQHAATIARYGPQVLTWFPRGSGPESGHKTHAKAEIWTDWATFRQRAQAFESESARFNAAAQSGDLAAIRAGQKALGTTCKNCHDRFRHED